MFVQNLPVVSVNVFVFLQNGADFPDKVVIFVQIRRVNVVQRSVRIVREAGDGRLVQRRVLRFVQIRYGQKTETGNSVVQPMSDDFLCLILNFGAP